MSAFDKVIGYKSVKAELGRIADIIKNPQKYEKYGVSFPKGIVLYGEPGVGKTLICNSFIEECGINHYVCRKTESGGDFVKTIKRTFEEAVNNQPAIILLDDMDKFANGDEQHADCEEYVTVQACIDNVGKNKVFVLATVNNLRKIPQSLIRAGRFDKQIEINIPKGKEAIEIVSYYLSQKPNLGEVDPVFIARLLSGCSCAELELVINDAGIYAGAANKECIEMEDIIKACLRVIYNAPETIQEDYGETDEKVAWHEVGHALISEILEPNSVTVIAVQGYEGNNKGFTAYYRDEKYWSSYNLMLNRVITLLGGKAATEIKYGEIDVGCGSDIQRATGIIERMTGEYLANGFGHVEMVRHSTSEEWFAKCETTIGNEMNNNYMKAKKIIAQNIEFAEKLVKELVDKRLLTTDDVQRIKKTCTIKYIS